MYYNYDEYMREVLGYPKANDKYPTAKVRKPDRILRF